MSENYGGKLETIGFIGLGNMGGNMARCLQKAGYSPIIHDLVTASGDELVAGGATWADSAIECAANADLQITSLPRPDHVREVMSGGTGALSALDDGTIWFDMTTNDRELLLTLATNAAKRDIKVCDAPVTGAVDGARKGQLTIFAGGEASVLDRVEPILSNMGRVIRCGELGSGNAVKLVTNYLWFTHAAVIGEGLLLGKQAGVSLRILWDAIRDSVGDSFVAHHDVPSIFAGHYDPSFTLGLCLKDLALCKALAADGGVPTPVGDEVMKRFELAAETYGKEAGELDVAKLLEEMAGTDLRLDIDFTPHWEA